MLLFPLGATSLICLSSSEAGFKNLRWKCPSESAPQIYLHLEMQLVIQKTHWISLQSQTKNPSSLEIFLLNWANLLRGQRRFYFYKYIHMCASVCTHTHIHTADGFISLPPVSNGIFVDNQRTRLPQNMISMTYCD